MPRVAASNGIKPELRALAVLKMGARVTPTEINDCVGTGDYASKYISKLRTRYGFEFAVEKDDRTVVAYVMTAEPANAEELRNMKPKEKVVKVKEDKPRKPRKVNRAFNAMPVKVKKTDKDAVKVLDDLGLTKRGAGEVGNYSVDADWDDYSAPIRDYIV